MSKKQEEFDFVGVSTSKRFRRFKYRLPGKVKVSQLSNQERIVRSKLLKNASQFVNYDIGSLVKKSGLKRIRIMYILATLRCEGFQVRYHAYDHKLMFVRKHKQSE